MVPTALELGSHNGTIVCMRHTLEYGVLRHIVSLTCQLIYLDVGTCSLSNPWITPRMGGNSASTAAGCVRSATSQLLNNICTPEFSNSRTTAARAPEGVAALRESSTKILQRADVTNTLY